MDQEILPFEDYKRIFETIYSVLRFVGLEPEKNCTYFSIIGAFLLNEHYGINCKSFSGLAAYMLNGDLEAVLAFGECVGENTCIASINAFHSWVANEDFIIDFQAPLFPEILSKRIGMSVCDSKMFQKHISLQCDSLMLFKKSGDFFHAPNRELTKRIVDDFADNPFNMNIGEICNNWFVNPIHKMKDFVEVTNDYGQMGKIHICKKSINGRW
ncbi:MAG: DUF2026 family protein [Smithella sp.]